MRRSLKVNNNTPMDAPPAPSLQSDLRPDATRSEVLSQPSEWVRGYSMTNFTLEAQTHFEERQDVASVA